jgi:hypothetical protein
LQPVQLVSTAAVPGEIANVEPFAPLPATVPPPHPAITAAASEATITRSAVRFLLALEPRLTTRRSMFVDAGVIDFKPRL